MRGSKKNLEISVNSPVILGFTLICTVALLLDWVTLGATTDLLFSQYHSSLMDPMTYVRFIGHIFGHAGWEHFIGNIMLLLVVGPLLEEKYGATNMIGVILSTAVVTGVVNYILFPRVQMLGASGVVFAMILLSSITSMKNGKIPLTFLLVAFIYIGEQIYQGIFINDNVANLSHILGGIVGAVFGFSFHARKRRR